MNTNIHICFDLDGTLIDSIPLMRDSWRNVNSTLNLKVGWEQYQANIGLHFDEICRNLGLEYVKDEIKKIYFEYNKNNIGKIQLMPGVSALLQELARQNISWSILTSKPKYTTEDIVQSFKFIPTAIICSDDVKIGKPHPESAELLHQKLTDYPITTIYYVGDTVIDHLFAINAGFKFIQFQHKPLNSSEGERLSEQNQVKLILNPRPIIHSMDILLSTLENDHLLRGNQKK